MNEMDHIQEEDQEEDEEDGGEFQINGFEEDDLECLSSNNNDDEEEQCNPEYDADDNQHNQSRDDN